MPGDASNESFVVPGVGNTNRLPVTLSLWYCVAPYNSNMIPYIRYSYAIFCKLLSFLIEMGRHPTACSRM